MTTTDYKFKVYKFQKRNRPVHVTDFVCKSPSFRQALNIFMHTCNAYVDIFEKNLESNDYSLDIPRSIARCTCRVDVYVMTEHYGLLCDRRDYELLTTFVL